jgi:hypothetical protein
VTRDDWMRRLGPLYGGAVALVTTTAWRWPTALGDEARVPGWIVVVGLPIGVFAYLIGAFVHALGTPASIGALFALAALAAASAGLAERGLADRIDRTARSFGGAYGRAGVPAVEPHATAPGPAIVVALVLFTLVRAAAIVAVAPGHWLGVLVATAVVGRWTAVFLQTLGDPIDDDGSRSLVATPASPWLVAALGLGALIIAVLALGKTGVVAVAVAAAGAFVLGIDAQHRDRGLSAPVVATAAALGELVVLVAASIIG